MAKVVHKPPMVVAIEEAQAARAHWHTEKQKPANSVAALREQVQVLATMVEKQQTVIEEQQKQINRLMERLT